jgi:nucleoside-diphosphate-sugar epimerase
MIWGKEFADVLPLMLDNTMQYVFISSARVYAKSDTPITETTPRLLDVSEDGEYLKTNEYALAKAREEDLLFKSGRKNFTIIRPTITYNSHRLQLGVLEMENWLYRALHGRSIVFSKDIAEKVTTMTYGDDVAKGIASVIGQEASLGEAFHITSPESLLWSEVLEIYLTVLEKHLGVRPKLVITETSTNLKFKYSIYQVIYCRYFNRLFDNTKISHFCDTRQFTKPQKGLAECLENFLSNPKFRDIDWILEAVNDRVSKEYTPLKEIPTIGSKVLYTMYRFHLELFLPVIYAVRRLLKGN